MKPKLFVDSDIILDLFLAREPHVEFAKIVFGLAEQGLVSLYVSSLIFSNLDYILSRQLSKPVSRQILQRLKLLVSVLSVDARVIDLALSSAFNDFEDAIQHYCAIQHQIPVILTRNIKDYKKGRLPVMTAEDYVKGLDRGQKDGSLS